MLTRYITTLGIVVILVSFAVSSLQFATRSQVLSGGAVDEALRFEFVLDADNNQTYIITPAIAQFLRERIRFRTEGPARVVAAKVDVTPKDVSWTENRHTITAPGAAIAVQLQWSTPADSANGAHGLIYLDFPEIPGFEGKTPSFHSGGYQKDDAGRYVVREITTYPSGFLLSLARFFFALTAGLPFGILLHTIGWAFVLKGEKRSRISAFPPQGGGLPETFYPDPVAEWTVWLLTLGIGSIVGSMMAGFSVSDGFMSSDLRVVVYSVLAIAAIIGFGAAYFTGKRLLTVRVDSQGIAYARGRGNLEWLNANWNDIVQFRQKSRTYRGNTTHWIEVDFNDKRKKLKIGQSIERYTALRDRLFPPQTVERTGS